MTFQRIQIELKVLKCRYIIVSILKTAPVSPCYTLLKLSKQIHVVSDLLSKKIDQRGTNPWKI